MLVAAENPVIVAGRAARTPKGLELLVELAEMLQAPVHDRPVMLRMNFPTRASAVQDAGAASPSADRRRSALESPGLLPASRTRMTPLNRFGMESRPTDEARREDHHDLVVELLTKSNYQDFGRYTEVDLAIAGRRGSDAAGADRGVSSG